MSETPQTPAPEKDARSKARPLIELAKVLALPLVTFAGDLPARPCASNG